METWLYVLITLLLVTIPAYSRGIFRTKKWENDILYLIPHFGWFHSLGRTLARSIIRNDGFRSDEILGQTPPKGLSAAKDPRSRARAIGRLAAMYFESGDISAALRMHHEALYLLYASQDHREVQEQCETVCRVIDSIEEGISTDEAEIVAGMVRTIQGGIEDDIYDGNAYRLREAKSKAEERYRELQ